MSDEIRLAAAPVSVLDTGEFEAVVSHVNRRDSRGDLIRPGAMQPAANIQVSADQHSSVPSAIDATDGEPRDQAPVAAASLQEVAGQIVGKGQFFLGQAAQAARTRVKSLVAGGEAPELSLTYQILKSKRVKEGLDILAARPLEFTFAKSGIMPGTQITRLASRTSTTTEGDMAEETTTATEEKTQDEKPEAAPANATVDLNVNLSAAPAAATEEAPAAEEQQTEEAPAEETLGAMQTRYTTLGEELRQVREQAGAENDFTKVKDAALRTFQAVQDKFNEFTLLGEQIAQRQALDKGLVSLNAQLGNPLGGNGGSAAEREEVQMDDEDGYGSGGVVRLRAYDAELDEQIAKAIETRTGVDLDYGIADMLAHPGHFQSEEGKVRLRATALANLAIDTEAARHLPLFRARELNLPMFTATTRPNWDIFRGSIPSAAPTALTNAGDASVADDAISSAATAATLLPVIAQDTIPSIGALDAAGRAHQIALLNLEIQRKLASFMFAALTSTTATDRDGSGNNNLSAWLTAKTALEDDDAEVSATVMRAAVFSRFRSDAAASTAAPGIYYGMVNDNPRQIDAVPVVTSGRVTAGSADTERIAYLGEWPRLRFIGRRRSTFEAIRDRLVEGVTLRLTGYYLFYLEQSNAIRQVTGLYQGATAYA